MADHLHYDKKELQKEYANTFALVMKVGMIAIAGVGIYFFLLMAYLGGWSHSKHAPFEKQFGERIQIDYSGLKLSDPPRVEYHSEDAAH